MSAAALAPVPMPAALGSGAPRAPILVRVGIPLSGGRLVDAAKSRGLPVLFSANAFARLYPATHERAGSFRRFARPDPARFAGLDASLDSAGFVAASLHGEYRWSVSDYLDLVESFPWTWWSSLDYACEPEIAEDRPLRFLRLAATARMLAVCRSEAARRGLPAPMPILQGWTPDEYALCARWCDTGSWPALVGLGSVCRRHVHGPNGILAILDAVDQVLPSHVRLHCFGVKSAALEYLSAHPRVASCDSMAWDFGARQERRTGRDMAFRISRMTDWAARQQRIAARRHPGAGVQASLFGVDPPRVAVDLAALVAEAIALAHAELVLSGDIEFLDVAWYCVQDTPVAQALAVAHGPGDTLCDELDGLIAGAGEILRGLAAGRTADALV